MQNSKEAVFDALDRLTTRHSLDEPQFHQASYIAEQLHISRSLASQYMNALHTEGQLVKIAARPALFFSRHALERRYSIQLKELTYLSREELTTQIDQLRSKRYNFEDVIGLSGSCKAVIEGIKAAACYPPHGLPFLLAGNVGTGKSLMRAATARWCVAEQIIPSERDCITLDSTSYTSDELVALLFGAKDGEHTGLLRKRSTKLVWLRNCQELDAETWAALLSYFDASGMSHASRLFFECCGTLSQIAHEGVVPSIPIACQMPDFANRELDEREAYVYRTFQDEAERIGCKVSISSAVARRLASRNFPDNLLGLTRAVRLTCANALASSEGHEGDSIRVFSSCVPWDPSDVVVEAHMYEEAPVFIDVTQYDPYAKSREPLRLLSQFIEILSNGADEPSDMNDARAKSSLSGYFEYMAHHRDDSSAFRAQESAAANIIHGIFEHNGMNEPVNFTNHLVVCLTFIRSNRLAVKEWRDASQTMLAAALQMAHQRYEQQFDVVVRIARSLQDCFGWKMDEGNFIAFTFYLHWYTGERCSSCLGVIVAHGYSTASSIADSVNTMLGNHVFDAVDMPLEVPNDEIVQALQAYLSKVPATLDLLIMVDMGSLEEIGARLNLTFNIDIGVVNNVSTATALEVGVGMLQRRPLTEILQQVQEHSACSYTIMQNRTLRDCIVFASENGVAAAARLADLFVKSLPAPVDVDIVTCDYFSLLDAEELPEELEGRNVLFLFGVSDPHVKGIRFVSLEDIVGFTPETNIGINLDDYLSSTQIEQLKHNLVRNFSLENLMRHLTILEPSRLMDAVSHSIESLQAGLCTHFSYRTTMRLYIHMSYLVERLVTKDALEYADSDTFIREHERFVELVRSSFENITRDYGVEVPIGEINYLFDLINLDDALGADAVPLG